MRSEAAFLETAHTQLAISLVGLCAAFSVWYDSTQELVQRLHINKKFFYLYGATCFFAYLYVRPLIRKRLGSASRGYINWSSVYIAWLCSAVFYHLPSLESMGLDVKADISMLLTVFSLSLTVLGVSQAAYRLAVLLKLAQPWLQNARRGRREAWATVVLNSMTLALACSTYYSFCGNAAGGTGVAYPVKDLVCNSWLPPVTTKQHPAFTKWVLYGEPANTSAPQAGASSAAELAVGGILAGGNGTCLAAGAAAEDGGEDSTGTCAAAGQLMGAVGGSSGTAAAGVGQTISPVFTMWLTLVMMFGVNCLSDYCAAAVMRAVYDAHINSAEWRRQRSARHAPRRRSADFSYEMNRPPIRPRNSMEALFSSVSDMLPTNLWSPTTGALKAASDRLMSWRDDSLVGLAALAREYKLGGSASFGRPPPAPAPKLSIPLDAPQPSFLPMFPWYSGTSADLLKTLFDLLISVKLFLGRFDMRTMQVATGTLGNGPDPAPQDGDGFTYEHLAHKEELWFDFCADTGDGGDPTYAVARCMAAPQLQVTVPDHLLNGEEGGREKEKSGSSTGVPKVLPRAQLLVHGGDLAYPNPTDETYEQRLFKPYEAALPPPSHVHPGQLVAGKPNLPAQYWAAGAGAVSCKCLPGGGQCGTVGAEQQRQCKLCHKAETLRAYDGPTCFMVPGNHDWIDGLETFQRHVQHKGWIGGWLLPQEKSYFALRLPHGWWLFGIDLALVDDIDMCQFRYFARIAEERMGPNDQAILAMHCPTWLVDWFWGSAKCANLRQLVRGPLRGRARVSIAGDLHFFMRHSFKPYNSHSSPSLSPSFAPSELSTPHGSSPQGMSPTSSHAPTPTPSLRGYVSPSQLHQTLMARLTGGGGSSKDVARSASAPPAPASTVAQQAQQQAQQGAGQQQTQQGTGQQQAQQSMVFGRSVDMDSVPTGASPAGGSPLGGSPTVPSMLLDAIEGEERHAAVQGGGTAATAGSAAAQPLARQASSGSRWSAAASLAAAAMKRRGWGSSTAPPSESSDPGGSPTANDRLTLELGPGRASTPVPVGAGRNRATLPILSPVHGSTIELSGLGDGISVTSALAAAAAGAGNGSGGGSEAGAQLGANNGTGASASAASSSEAAPAPGGGRRGASPAASEEGGSGSGGKHAHRPSAPGALEVGFDSSGSSPTRPVAPVMAAAAAPVAAGAGGASGGIMSATSSPFGSWWPGLRSRGSAGSVGEAARAASELSAAGSASLGRRPAAEEEEEGDGEGWQLNDPEHLVVSGSGGGFLHPTHVFSYSRFRPVHDAASGSVFLRPPGRGRAGGGGLRRSRGPSCSSLYSLSHQENEAEAAPPSKPPGGEYRCQRAFPSPEQSLRLGKGNLHTFRMTNNRFDIIGGMLYFLLVVSVLPRCSGVADILDAHTILEALHLFVRAGWDTVVTILLESYLSLFALGILFLMCLGFARSGGIGAMDGVDPALRRRPEFHGSSMQVRMRIGGLATQLLYASAHALAHLTAAISLLLLLELGIETVMRYEGVGRKGYHSLYKWYRAYEALHFPDPMGLRLILERWTLGLYPNGIKWVMAVFDLPEAICVSRTSICTAGGALAQLTRIQAAGFYLGVLAFYWLLATPTVGFLFGCYLFLSVNLFHVHYDEAFSSLQVPDFKGFCRFHITRSGDLEMFALGLEKVPSCWREDPRWRTPQGGGSPDTPSHKAKYPSRWLPVEEGRLGPKVRGGMLRAAPPPEAQLKVVDYLLVPRYRRT